MNILIVEDEQALARALDLKLQHEGYTVTRFDNGKDGAEAMKDGNFDLVILDLMMPGMDGFKVLEFIAEHKIKTPAMVLSNLSMPDDEQRARDLGAVDFFVKSNTPIGDIVAQVKKRVKKSPSTAS